MKKYILSLFVAVMSVFGLTSCLTSGIDDYEESFDGADIISVVDVYYRYIDASGNVKQVRLPRTNPVIDNDEQTVLVEYLPTTVPADQADKFSQSSMVVVLSISTAAVIKPVGDAPKLGVPGDWSKPNQYEVTAANGTKKIWTVTVELYQS